MELAIILLMVLIILVIGLMSFIILKSRGQSNTSNALLLKEDLRALSEDITRLKDGVQAQIGDRMDKSQSAMFGAMQKQSVETNKIIADITKNLTELKESNRRVIDVADALKTLQNVLQNPKQRGGLGEYYLDTVLGNVLPPHVYEMQYRFKDGEIVDAVIKLDKGRLLPIDSKFSLENYNRLIEEKDKTAREAIVKVFKSDLKLRIDETSKYIRPMENTLDYAFMFIPSEAIYYDLLVNNVGATGTNARDLIEYAFIDKKVIIVSPTTLLAYLQTVLQGLKSLQIEDQAKDIQKRVAELGKHIAAHDSYMQKLGNSLGTTINHYNAAHKALGHMDRDVVKIAQTNPSVAPLVLDKPLAEDEI
ncbi:DNA recombination protein RmuC [Candidatus Saccharibacteria bacterium]|nr:DNA recombination protein RmuC [Candidatus Saccharibacteria bacterium]